MTVSRPLTVLSVAYPFACVTADPVGGAEQVLAKIDQVLVADGHRSIVIAPDGSSVAGELRSIGPVPPLIDDRARERAHASVRGQIAEALAEDRPDIVHLHGVDFDAYRPEGGPPVVVTLHLPLAWYPAGALQSRPGLFLHPVSRDQARRHPAGAALGEPIPNGVPDNSVIPRKGGFALALGRICPEKGFDDAIRAARLADVPLLIAGEAFPYPAHQQHLTTAILPQLGRRCRWVGPVAGHRKRTLLAEARCVLIPSRAPETSSLVAMEALAAGTPVIATRQGALPEIVEHGRTGYVVDTVEEMAAAITVVDRLDSVVCRAAARQRFSVRTMTDAYLARYHALSQS